MEDTIIKALLLGYAHIECNGTPIRICLKKAQGLLFYLLVHKKATRDELTGLLWGGEDNELARRHLRDNLYHLKKVVPIELVVPAGRSAIQLNPELGFYIDVDEFLKAVDVEAYQGEFLKGFSVPNCYEYEEWLERTRTSLREAYLQQLDKRAEFCLSEGKDGEAEALWRKYLQEEPLCETVSISLMRFYRAQKDYNRAALIYRGLHKAMADTLGIAPLKDTSELYYSIMKEWNEQSENGEISDDFLVGRQNQLQYLLHLFSRMHTSKHARSFVILGVYGSFAAKTLANRLNAKEFRCAVDNFVQQAEMELGQYYKTKDVKGNEGVVRHIILSEVLICPECDKELSYFENGTKRNPVQFTKTITCPHCGKTHDTDTFKPALENIYDSLLKKEIVRKKREPVWVYGTTNGKNWDRKVNDEDRVLIKMLEEQEFEESDIPREICWGELHRTGYHLGITHLHQFYTKRIVRIFSAPKTCLYSSNTSRISWNTLVGASQTRRFCPCCVTYDCRMYHGPHSMIFFLLSISLTSISKFLSHRDSLV